MNRDAEIVGFLAGNDLAEVQWLPLAGDASRRRYLRLASAGRPCLVMDVPPESGLATLPYLEVTAWLRSKGYSAPEVLAADAERGLVLIEDLGDDLFAGLCRDNPGQERLLYEAAVDLLADMQGQTTPGNNGGWTPPPYDMTILMREVRLVVEWYLPAATGVAAGKEVAADFERLACEAFAGIPETPPVVVYRDYHAENLIWLPSRPGLQRVGLLDFQDMLMGHPAYDLVSLLDDARRDVDPVLRSSLMERYLVQTGRNRADFLHAAQVLTVQRNLKILGLFTRLCRQEGKPRYLDLLPRVWSHLERNLDHPALVGLAEWFRVQVPFPDAGVRALIGRQAA